MGVLSKLYRDCQDRLGPERGLLLARGVYTAIIAGYVAHVVAVPAWKKATTASKKKPPSAEKDEEEDEEAKKLRVVSEEEEARRRKRREAGPAVNREFFGRLQFLLKIMFPRLLCRESGLLALHTLVLVARTFLSIYVARLEGTMVKFIVQKDVASFARSMGTWFTVAVPATFVNSAIKFLESQLALSFRSRLVDHAYGLYFTSQTYYRVSNLDSRLENADHSLTDDISAFAQSVAHLYSHVSKPLLDSAMFSFQMYRLARSQKSNSNAGPFLSGVVVWATGRILRLASPRFGKMVAEEANRKAYLRHIHSRIITNAEEIAFYGGQDVELGALRKAYRSLVNQSRKIYAQRLWYVMLEQFLMKYGWAGTGMVVIAIPILTSTAPSGSDAASVEAAGDAAFSRTEYYSTAKNLLTSAADAMERLMTAYKEIVELAGYTSRVATMMVVFRDCSEGTYRRTAAPAGDEGVAGGKRDVELLGLDFVGGVPVSRGDVVEVGDGTIVLEQVPIVTPNCDVVVPSLDLKVFPGVHLLITGPNGCGKSSLFRIISGLWPVYKGKLRKPPIRDMFYIPQRPYMSVGSLREQVIYPDTVQDMTARGMTDVDLERILDTVHLGHLVKREGGWGVIGDWKDILSGGEKQRLGMARLFYRRPRFALLDECTSAVSIDVEGRIYQAAKDQGITLMTITHRPSLWKFHTHVLQFDGEGGWKLSQLDSGAQLLTLAEERQQLERQLEDVGRARERLAEVCQLMAQAEEGQEK